MLCLMVGLLGVAPVAPAEGPPFPRIANCYSVQLTADSTERDLEEIARFDLLIGGVWCDWGNPEQVARLNERMAEVRRRNPHITIIDFSSSAPYAYPSDAGFPADGWLLQPDGRRILGWPGTEMTNLTKPEVLTWLAGRSQASVRDRGFDGTFIDCMGSGFDSWACNIEHHEPYQVDADGDGAPDDAKWLDAAWTSAKTDLARAVRERIGAEAAFMANGAGAWGLPTMNGILLEDVLDYVLDGGREWDSVLDEYLKWTVGSAAPTLTTIVSSSGIEPPYDAWRLPQPEQDALLERGRGLHGRMRFGLATALMGDGYFAYDLHTRWRGQRWWYPEYDAPLGYPTGPAERQPDGSWRRGFDGGTVVVNPTALDVRVALAGPHVDASSREVSASFVVPSQDGRILLPTDLPPSPGTLPASEPLTLDGTDAVAMRGDRVLVRFAGLGAVFDGRGRMLAITDGRETLATNLQTFAVTRPWQDYGYEECSHERMPDGGVRFVGVRAFDTNRVGFEVEVRTRGDSLEVRQRWQALTAAEFVMFRPQLDFPARRYGGGEAAGEGATVPLPAERAPAPSLIAGADWLRLAPPDGRALVVRTEPAGSLVDERHYGVDAFRLGLHPAPGAVDAGYAWECRWVIEAP
jgi:hypothetical protein